MNEMNEWKQLQNLKEIQFISASRTKSVLDVLRTLQCCEEIQLNPDQMDMGSDILNSINKHGKHEQSVASLYLIRYGMLIERKKAAHSATNTQSGKVENN